MPRRKIWTPHEDNVKSDFGSYVQKNRETGQEDAFVEGYWKVLKITL